MSLTPKDIITTVIADEHHWKIQLLKAWPEIIGPLEKYVIIDSIKENFLVLMATHSAWAQELTYLIPLIKEKINALFPDEKIAVIRIKTGKRTIKAHNFPRRKQMQSPVIRERALTGQEQDYLSKIYDHELRSALQRFLILSSPLPKEP